MSVMQIRLPHRNHAVRTPREGHLRAIVEGLVALLALIALIGAVAGAATWGVLRLLTLALS